MIKDNSKINYQSFTQIHDDDNVVINVIPQSNEAFSYWRHYINDLDFFFKKIYKYHQYGGFFAILVKYFSQIIQFIFVVLFTILLINFIDYDKLFMSNNTPRSFVNIFKNLDQVYFHTWEYIILILIIISFVWRTIKLARKTTIYYGIKQFYVEALRIKDCNLFTWQEIQNRLIEAERICLFQGKNLTELDVHNRILRRKNYMIALINKQLLPIYYRIPLIGETIYLPKGLLYCFQLLLFKAPGIKLFETRWKLKDEYKQFNKREECAKKFSNNCKLLAIIMGIFGIFFSFWQFLNMFYTYADEAKSNPTRIFSFRNWSNYSKIYCRHFNELDHDLEDRMNKAHKHATKYMNSFISIPLESFAKLIRFMAGAILAVITLLTLYSEYVLSVEHMLTLVTALIFVSIACQGFIREDVPQRYNQLELYSYVLQYIHYFPSKHLATTQQARSEFTILFKYKIVSIIEELFSPIITPFVLYKHMTNKSLDIIDFFRNCSIEIPGIGDVCSFAMMNIEKNGNPSLRKEFEGRHKSEPQIFTNVKPSTSSTNNKSSKPVKEQSFRRSESFNMKMMGDSDSFNDFESKPSIPTENGKLELSLIHFKNKNPNWKPFDSQANFIDNLNRHMKNSIKNNSLNLSKNEISSAVDLVNKSILPRTPYSSFINDEEMFMPLNNESTEFKTTMSSLFLQNKLAELVVTLPKETEHQPLLSQSVPMATYSSNLKDKNLL